MELKGKEKATGNSFGIVDYCDSFSAECSYSFGEDDWGRMIKCLPENSRYIKSEDILYEIKKIQQRQILSDGMEYDYVQKGMSLQPEIPVQQDVTQKKPGNGSGVIVPDREETGRVRYGFR